MHKFVMLALALVFVSSQSVIGQQTAAPTLRIVTEDPSLPSEIYYGDVKVKPLRLRPGSTQRITIQDSDFFVQQHYVDFLNRLPDQSGISYWVNQIAECNADAACIDSKRVNTSGAFFVSTEFQQTGYLVYRFYKASYGRMPRYAEFMPDTRRISSGVVVNADGWQQKLEANKSAFAAEWAARTDFKTKYDALSSEQYVDALFSSAGVTPDAAGRTALVAGLNSGGETRATVLRKVAENPAFDRKEFNSAFVLMQYFGYLRRNPDDAPDGNLAGYKFWLDKLDAAGGDFRKAEMVKAFIASSEYGARF